MFCKECGKILTEKEKFCTGCGAVIPPPIVKSKDDKKGTHLHKIAFDTSNIDIKAKFGILGAFVGFTIGFMVSVFVVENNFISILAGLLLAFLFFKVGIKVCKYLLIKNINLVYNIDKNLPLFPTDGILKKVIEKLISKQG